MLPFPTGPELVVVVAGEADLATAGQLRAELVAALGNRPRTMVVDVADLAFCDLQGLDALNDAARVAQDAGVTVALRGMSAQLAWLHRRFPWRPPNRWTAGPCPASPSASTCTHLAGVRGLRRAVLG